MSKRGSATGDSLLQCLREKVSVGFARIVADTTGFVAEGSEVDRLDVAVTKGRTNTISECAELGAVIARC